MRRWVFLAGWIALVLATQAWRPWRDGISLGYATDVASYERIALAAPGLPSVRLQLQHAERFAPHWLVGAIAAATGIPLHDLYWAATSLVLLALFLAIDAALAAAAVAPAAHGLALGLLVASVFPVHYLLDAPGMLQDAVFLAGLAVALLGFARGRFLLVLAGLAVGTLGRESMVPVGLAAAVWIVHAPAWRPRRAQYAAIAALIPAALYTVLHEVAVHFAQPADALSTITVIGSLGQPAALAEHLGRSLLPLLVPFAVLMAAAIRAPGRLPRGPLLLGAVVLAETLSLAPDWTAHNEPRLAALALPPVVVAVGILLSRAPLEGWRIAIVAASIVLASLHHLYTRLPTESSAAWPFLSALAAALAFAALLGRKPRTTQYGIG